MLRKVGRFVPPWILVVFLIHVFSEAVYQEMQQGPLAPGAEQGVREVKDALRRAPVLLFHCFPACLTPVLLHPLVATSRADAVFQPILDARTKAERLKSTLGVFERSKFFFNLPGILGEAVEAVGKFPLVLPFLKHAHALLTDAGKVRCRPSSL